jgi:uncharacterized protein (TIGR03083 family)
MTAWPWVPDLVRTELTSYLDLATEMPGSPTACPPWTVTDLTAHLVTTFGRFRVLLSQTRSGDFTKPFEPEELSRWNLATVAEFSGDAFASLRDEVEGFIAEADNPGEMMAHQSGPIPVALQMLFGLNELVLHHHDVLPYRPERTVLEPLLDLWQRRYAPLPEEPDPWHRILIASGRTS